MIITFPGEAADAVFALVMGLYTDLNPVPTITGNPNLVRLLTEELKEIRVVCSMR